MKLFLIRHALPAPTSYDNRPPGPGLGEKGIRQAEWISQFIGSYLPARIASSDFTRCMETAQILIASSQESSLEIDIRWRERQAEEESHASLLARISDWRESLNGKTKPVQIVVAHGGSINAMLELLDPNCTQFSYPYRDQWGIFTPIASIWEINTERNQAQLHPCPIQ